jgi:hypothetical protein
VVKKFKAEALKCGAKLRDGTLCAAPLAKERTRCLKHGGAPRSGAPKGNSNALKHGAYADRGNRSQITAIERAVEHAMTSTARLKQIPHCDAPPATATEKTTGHQIFKDAQQMLSKLTSMLSHHRHMDVSTRTIFFARRDALVFLLKEPSWFESGAAFRWGVSLTFEQRRRARTKLRDDEQIDRFEYDRAWGKLCRELYLNVWP